MSMMPPRESDEGPPLSEQSTHTFKSNESGRDTVIGCYRLLQLIGQGGMGEVWLAEQMEPVRRRVAIKLIKAGMDTREIVARFESEMQALALMDHPSIAKVFEAGSTANGHPYFAMEFVSGLPITDYCDKHKLSVEQRLELFTQVCEGVQHAHQKAIIHRDLKPSNILVSEVNGKPLARIIDFGVAKATSLHAPGKTMFTRLGTVVGTMGYMSPEQADSTGVDVDTRTDVYSLGVVMYELLVGVRPYDFHELAFLEIVRRLREDDAPRPSTKARTLGEQSPITAQNRGLDPPHLAQQLRGDLDAISLKALEKERSHRYGSVSEMAADIGRYLRHEPIVARPASAAYRAGKYFRRHRIGVLATALLTVLLISFAIAQAFQVRRIRRERDRANRITEFMTNMFAVSDPNRSRGNTITAREIMDRASKEIDAGLAHDPELQARMMDVMGGVYYNLGLFARAQPLLERSAGIRERVLGPINPETLQSKQHVARVLQAMGKFAEAERLQRETLQVQRRIMGAEHPDTLQTLDDLGVTILTARRREAEAEKLLRETLEIQRRVLGPEHPDTLRTMLHLGNALTAQARHSEVEKLQIETLEIQRRVLGPEHMNTLASMLNLGLTLQRERRYADAEKLQREGLDLYRRVMGAENPATLLALNNLAATVTLAGRYAEAETLIREVADTGIRVSGPEDPQTLVSLHNLAAIISQQGRYAEAEKMELRTRDIRRRVLGPEHPDTASSTYTLGCFAALQGRRNEAFVLLGDAVDHGLYAWADLAMDKDPDLNSLRDDPRFAPLLARAKERAEATRRPQ
jgi:serine/threonine protein kinase/tetratricopeptide (TPR) repeat protein